MEFAFKELKVWQKSIDFVDKVLEISENLNTSQKHYRIMEQIESAVISISNNISEGKGRYSKKEFVQFLFIARGSLNETVSILNVFERRKWISPEILNSLENDALEIVQMIKGLINSIKGSK